MKKNAYYKGIRNFISLLSVLLLCACATQHNKVLFVSGEQGWLSSGESEWKFLGDELVGHASESSGFVMTEEPYSDFILELEFFPDDTINSGVFARCSDIALSAEYCYEFNIWDEHPDQKWRTGAVVGRVSPIERVYTLDQWNTYKIQCEKDMIRAWINGTLVVDLKNDELNAGHIGLQASGKGTIRFRNIRIFESTD